MHPLRAPPHALRERPPARTGSTHLLNTGDCLIPKPPRSQRWQRTMEPLWSPVVATGGNQRQIGQKPHEQAKTVAGVATGRRRQRMLSEGVSGSSPEAGFAKAPHIGAFVQADLLLVERAVRVEPFVEPSGERGSVIELVLRLLGQVREPARSARPIKPRNWRSELILNRRLRDSERDQLRVTHELRSTPRQGSGSRPRRRRLQRLGLPDRHLELLSRGDTWSGSPSSRHAPSWKRAWNRCAPGRVADDAVKANRPRTTGTILRRPSRQDVQLLHASLSLWSRHGGRAINRPCPRSSGRRLLPRRRHDSQRSHKWRQFSGFRREWFECGGSSDRAAPRMRRLGSRSRRSLRQRQGRRGFRVPSGYLTRRRAPLTESRPSEVGALDLRGPLDVSASRARPSSTRHMLFHARARIPDLPLDVKFNPTHAFGCAESPQSNPSLFPLCPEAVNVGVVQEEERVAGGMRCCHVPADGVVERCRGWVRVALKWREGSEGEHLVDEGFAQAQYGTLTPGTAR
jgi:hypothetical protein